MESNPFYIMCVGFGVGVACTFASMQYYIQENYVNSDEIPKYVKESGLNYKICNDLKLYDKRVIAEYVTKSGFTHLVCNDYNQSSHIPIKISNEKSTIIHKDLTTPIEINSDLDELLNPKPQIPSQEDSRPLPKEIIEKIDSIALESPYQAKELAKSYIGQKIRWTVYFSSVHNVRNEESLLVLANPFIPSRFAIELPNIVFMVDLKKYPFIKNLSKGKKLIITGTIEEVSYLSIDLEAVDIKI